MLCRAPRSRTGGTPLVSLPVLSFSLGWWPWSWSTEEEVKGCDNGVRSLPAGLLLVDRTHCLLLFGCVWSLPGARTSAAAWTRLGARGGTGEPSSITSFLTSPKTRTGCYHGVPCPLEEDGPCPNTPLGVARHCTALLASALSTGR